MNRRGLRGTCASQSRCGSPCTWQRKPSSAYFSARTIPDLASRSDASTSWQLFPMEETMPMPVTTTRLMRKTSSLRLGSVHENTSRSRTEGGYLVCFEEADPQVVSHIDDVAICLHDTIGDCQLQPAQDHPLQVDDVLDFAHAGHDHASELDLADPKRAASARCADPAEEEPRKLPQRIEPQAPRHDRITREMALEEPVVPAVAGYLQLGGHLALAVRSPGLR